MTRPLSVSAAGIGGIGSAVSVTAALAGWKTARYSLIGAAAPGRAGSFPAASTNVRSSAAPVTPAKVPEGPGGWTVARVVPVIVSLTTALTVVRFPDWWVSASDM